jgi:hypothetical protein
MKHPATSAYTARRTAEGPTPKQILRCLKRYTARQLFRLMQTTALATTYKHHLQICCLTWSLALIDLRPRLPALTCKIRLEMAQSSSFLFFFWRFFSRSTKTQMVGMSTKNAAM